MCVSVVCNIVRVPTAPGKPGKMMKAFPVMEISWNFEILKNIMENEKKPGKMRISVHSSQQLFSLQNVIFFQMICPLKITCIRH